MVGLVWPLATRAKGHQACAERLRAARTGWRRPGLGREVVRAADAGHAAAQKACPYFLQT